MVNFVLKENDSFQLNSVMKSYKYDQDKYIHPKATYANAFRILKKYFPEKPFNLKELRSSDIISAFEFGDGFLTSRGKGATIEQSKASGIMEYCERFSWLNFDYKNAPGYMLKSFNDLKNEVNLEGIDKVFYISYSKNKQKLYELAKDIPFHWVQGYSLTNNRYTLYPINWNNLYQSTNGLASGNIKEETILQGICEIIERHNSAEFINNLSNIHTEIIDKDSIENEVLRNLLNLLKKHNIDIHLINATLGLKVSTIIACGIDNNPEIELLRTGYGYGCHTDPQKAIIRAVTEYCLGRETVYSKKNPLHKLKLEKGQWQFKLNIDLDKILNTSKIISYKDLPDLSNDDIKEEIFNTVKLLKENGFETIIIDKTHPLIKIPVYRIFVPGIAPGTSISTFEQNEHFQMVLAYFQGGQKDIAQKYYEEHFSEISQEFTSQLELLRPQELPIPIDNLLSLFNPKTLPLEAFCREDFQEQLKLSMKAISGNQESILEMISKMNKSK